MIWLDKECSSDDFTYKSTSEHSAVPTQLSTLCLKMNYRFSVPMEKNHFICWIGLLFWHPWKPRVSFLGIVSTSLTVWRQQTRSQQMALGSCSCSEVVLEVSGSSEKHCSGIRASPALKMVLVPLTVSRWLVTLSPTTLWRSWLLFRAAKNKTPLVLPLGAVGREEPSIPKVSWHELWSSFLLLWAPGRWCSRVCKASGFLSAFPHILVPGDLEQQLLSLDSVFLWSRRKYINYFFSTREQFGANLLNKLLLKESELQEWFWLDLPSC